MALAAIMINAKNVLFIVVFFNCAVNIKLFYINSKYNKMVLSEQFF